MIIELIIIVDIIKQQEEIRHYYSKIDNKQAAKNFLPDVICIIFTEIIDEYQQYNKSRTCCDIQGKR
jgi:hypothetical protein